MQGSVGTSHSCLANNSFNILPTSLLCADPVWDDAERPINTFCAFSGGIWPPEDNFSLQSQIAFCPGTCFIYQPCCGGCLARSLCLMLSLMLSQAIIHFASHRCKPLLPHLGQNNNSSPRYSCLSIHGLNFR